MALQEKRVLKTVTFDHVEKVVIVQHNEQILRDGELMAQKPVVEDFREVDYDRLAKRYPDVAAAARSSFKWSAASAKAANRAVSVDEPPRAPDTPQPAAKKATKTTAKKVVAKGKK